MSGSDSASPVLGLRIIQADLDHIDLVAPLFDAYRVFYGVASDPEAARRYIHDRLSNLQSVVFLALSEDGREVLPLGFVQLYPSFSSISLKRIWILNDLYVDEAYRTQGIGRALIEKARHLALKSGARGIIVANEQRNHAARRLFESLGFVHDDEFHHFFLNVELEGV